MYQGGLIFYLDTLDVHPFEGLVSAPSDQASSREWGCLGTEITGADGVTVGTGEQNTIDIEADCTTTGIAAHVCANLSLNGYADWFLPSKDELTLMYHNLHVNGFGNFENLNYWSSTESDNTNAWKQNFTSGNQNLWNKGNSSRVRAVRVF
jgi:hypothetical protein